MSIQPPRTILLARLAQQLGYDYQLHPDAALTETLKPVLFARRSIFSGRPRLSHVLAAKSGAPRWIFDYGAEPWAPLRLLGWAGRQTVVAFRLPQELRWDGSLRPAPLWRRLLGGRVQADGLLAARPSSDVETALLAGGWRVLFRGGMAALYRPGIRIASEEIASFAEEARRLLESLLSLVSPSQNG